MAGQVSVRWEKKVFIAKRPQGTAQKIPRILTWLLVLELACVPTSWGVRTGAMTDTEVLLTSYMGFMVAQQVPAAAASLNGHLDPRDSAQLDVLASAWLDDRIQDVREVLATRFGAEARATFEVFVARFTQAENEKDGEYLASLSRALGLEEPWPATYADLRTIMVDAHLAGTITESAMLLGELQTWVKLKGQGEQVPELALWLARSDKTKGMLPKAMRVQRPSPPPSELDALEAAEAPLPEFHEDMVEEGSPMDAFSEMREARREKVVDEAQAGMQQVAAERQAAEDEYAAKKLADAQKEAEAMKRHAEELAAVEAEALDQRKHSWNNRLKKIVATATGSFGGAFLGSIGAKAGEEAVDAVWPDSR